MIQYIPAFYSQTKNEFDETQHIFYLMLRDLFAYFPLREEPAFIQFIYLPIIHQTFNSPFNGFFSFYFNLIYFV